MLIAAALCSLLISTSQPGAAQPPVWRPPPEANSAQIQAGIEASKGGRLLVVQVMSDRAIRDKPYREVWSAPEVRDWLEPNATVLLRWPSSHPADGEDPNEGFHVYRDGKHFDSEGWFDKPAELLEWLGYCRNGVIPDEYAKRRAGDPGEFGFPSANYARRLQRAGKTEDLKRWCAAALLGQYERRLAPLPAQSPPQIPADPFDVRGTGRGSYFSYEAPAKALIESDEPTRQAFEALRDKAASAAEANPADRRAVGTWYGLMSLVPDPARLARWFESLEGRPDSKALAKDNREMVILTLVRQERWADAGRFYVRPLGTVAKAHLPIDMIEALSGGGAIERNQDWQRELEFFSADCGIMYACLLAAGRDRDAEMVSEAAIDLEDSPIVRRAMILAALKANQPRPLHLEWADEVDAAPDAKEKLRPRVEAALKDSAPK